MSENLSPFPDDEQAQQKQSGDQSQQAPGPRPADDADDARWGPGRRRYYRRSTGSWIAGAILVAVGLIFLLENAGLQVPFLENWWALFILIPAVAAFGRGIGQVRANNGQITRSARGAFLSGFFLTLLTVGLLFSLQWQYVWPVLLILAGLGALLTALTAR